MDGDYLRFLWIALGVCLSRRAYRGVAPAAVSLMVLAFPLVVGALCVGLNAVMPDPVPPACHAPNPGCLFP